jgi:sugar porter (SP) family MFS transporter
MPQSGRRLSVYFISSIAALGGLLFGYDTGVISGAQLFLVKTFSLNSQQQEWAVSCVLIGAIIGSVIAGRLNDLLGRKLMLLTLAVVFALGAIFTALAPNFTIFIIFRIVVGLGIGAAASVVPVYISEIAPSYLRGQLVTFNQLAITVGIVVSYLVDLLFTHLGMGWPPMFATATIPAALLFLGMLVCPETPRWLASKGRWADAHRVLSNIKGADADRETAEIRTSLEEHAQRGGFRDLLVPGIRMALIVGVGLAVFQQFVGINTVIYYAPTIFQAAGIQSASSAILATVVVGIVNVLSTIVALFLVDRLGRRVLLIAGCIGMVIGLIFLGAIFAIGPTQAGGLTLAALIVYIFSFAISMGPVFWLMSAEIFPTRVRAAGAGTCSFANWVCNFLVSVTFLSLIGAIGRPFTFWLYATIGILALIFCLTLVPETKGRTLEQIEAYWMHGRQWAGGVARKAINPQQGD